MKLVFNVDGKNIPAQSLRYKSRADQIEAMRNWFFENYEDPANACPYESREGGYHYIYGGPYDAHDELQEMFGDFVKLDYIEELVDELQSECFEWSGNSNNSDWYDDDIYDAVISSEEPYDKFLENVGKIKAVAKLEHDNVQKEYLLNLLFTNVITALETLYVELYIKYIEEDDGYIADCIEKGKTEFKVSKDIAALPFRGESIEKIREELIKAVKAHLINVSWHNTEAVVRRYKATFDIKVENDWPIDEIQSATLTRNHLVHRGGKDKDGVVVMITEQELDKLLGHALAIGEKLFKSLKNALEQKTSIVETEF